MSLCTFLAAACDLPEKMRPDGCIPELGPAQAADEDYGLYAFPDFDGHTALPHAVCLEWDGFTPGRAEHLIAYLRAALERCERVELRHVWLTGYCEYDERPFRKTKRVSLRDLTPHDLEAICEFDVWAQDQTRPTDVCLIITR